MQMRPAAGVPDKEFERLVREALKSLPKRFKERLKNVDVVIEDRKVRHKDLGWYEGLPLAERTQDYSFVLPDKITLFKRNLEAACMGKVKLKEEIRQTVLHEIAHHFGMTDEELKRGKIY